MIIAIQFYSSLVKDISDKSIANGIFERSFMRTISDMIQSYTEYKWKLFNI